MSRLWPDEIVEFVMNNYAHIGAPTMTGLINETFGTQYKKNQVKSLYKRLGIKSDQTGRFVKGQRGRYFEGGRHPNAQKCWFKEGREAPNRQTEGHVSDWAGYAVKKINGRWEALHRLKWMDAYGPLKKGEAVIFLDGDKKNLELSNLEKVTRQELARLNKQYPGLKDPELRKAALNVIRLEAKIKEREEKKNEGKKD